MRRYWQATSFRDHRWVEDPPGEYGPDGYCRYITDFIRAQAGSGKPFFAYYPMVLVHSPFPQTPGNLDDPQPGWAPEDNLRIHEDLEPYLEALYLPLAAWLDRRRCRHVPAVRPARRPTHLRGHTCRRGVPRLRRGDGLQQ